MDRRGFIKALAGGAVAAAALVKSGPQKHFGKDSGKFDGVGDFVSVDNEVWDFGKGDWTVEFFYRCDGKKVPDPKGDRWAHYAQTYTEEDGKRHFIDGKQVKQAPDWSRFKLELQDFTVSTVARYTENFTPPLELAVEDTPFISFGV